MNVAYDLLDDLAVIGATLQPAGDRLILRAGRIAIPAALVHRVREAKADLIATLAGDEARGACIVKWLNQHPAPSAPGRGPNRARERTTQEVTPHARED
jgi:hypothetical protein